MLLMLLLLLLLLPLASDDVRFYLLSLLCRLLPLSRCLPVCHSIDAFSVRKGEVGARERVNERERSRVMLTTTTTKVDQSIDHLSLFSSVQPTLSASVPLPLSISFPLRREPTSRRVTVALVSWQERER